MEMFHLACGLHLNKADVSLNMSNIPPLHPKLFFISKQQCTYATVPLEYTQSTHYGMECSSTWLSELLCLGVLARKWAMLAQISAERG